MHIIFPLFQLRSTQLSDGPGHVPSYKDRYMAAAKAQRSVREKSKQMSARLLDLRRIMEQKERDEQVEFEWNAMLEAQKQETAKRKEQERLKERLRRLAAAEKEERESASNRSCGSA